MPNSEQIKNNSQSKKVKSRSVADDGVPVFDPSDDYTLTPPPVELRDASLGRYMDAWSRLETVIHFAAQEILQIEADTGYAIWSAIQTFQSIKVLDAAAKLRLDETGQRRVAKICEQLARRNIRRNYIVHGTWRLRISMKLASGSQTYGPWVRVYDHIDPEMPKTDDGSSLTVQELDKTTSHVEEMVQALWSLVDDIPSLRVQQQTPSE